MQDLWFYGDLEKNSTTELAADGRVTEFIELCTAVNSTGSLEEALQTGAFNQLRMFLFFILSLLCLLMGRRGKLSPAPG